uniref:Slingshot N-terminal domain-containing protein n=1 Tax=Timema bartmani TaxID=61472 RepID=A0A7R9EVK9_9NEOP|nr:unnamed protein product [Timema bartmani]
MDLANFQQIRSVDLTTFQQIRPNNLLTDLVYVDLATFQQIRSVWTSQPSNRSGLCGPNKLLNRSGLCGPNNLPTDQDLSHLYHWRYSGGRPLFGRVSSTKPRVRDPSSGFPPSSASSRQIAPHPPPSSLVLPARSSFNFSSVVLSVSVSLVLCCDEREGLHGQAVLKISRNRRPFRELCEGLHTLPWSVSVDFGKKYKHTVCWSNSSVLFVVTSALQTLHKVSSKAREHNFFLGGLTHDWVSYYERRIESDRSCLNEWHTMDSLESRRPPSPDSVRTR